jgi:hypothetical protein
MMGVAMACGAVALSASRCVGLIDLAAVASMMTSVYGVRREEEDRQETENGMVENVRTRECSLSTLSLENRLQREKEKQAIHTATLDQEGGHSSSRSRRSSMSTWAEAGHILANNGPLGIPTSAVQFDSSSELLWTGSGLGQVASHYGPGLQRYTSWSAHPLLNGRSLDSQHLGGVHGLLCDERAIYSIGEDGIKAANRRGIVRWNMSSR